MVDEVPQQLRAAVAIVALEVLALLGGAGFLLWSTVFGHPTNKGSSVGLLALAVAAALVLGFGGRGLLRLRPSARTPVVMLQLLALPVSYSLAIQAGRVGYGGPILVAALAVLYLLFTPPARAALDRDPD